MRDLQRLQAFLAEHSDEASKRAIRSIRDGLKLLVAHPKLGRPIEDLPDEFREWIIPFGQSAYVVLYRLDDTQIVVLAVRHGREAGY